MANGPDMDVAILWVQRNHNGRKREAHAAIAILGMMHSGETEGVARREVLTEYRTSKGEKVPSDTVSFINHLVTAGLAKQREANGAAQRNAQVA